jgi:Acetyltransferase (GNAT) domain
MPQQILTQERGQEAGFSLPPLSTHDASSLDVALVKSGDTATMTAIGELWQRVYDRERGLIQCPDAATACHDIFHEFADYFAVHYVDPDCREKQLVATVRVVRDSPQGLPIERFFRLAPLKRYTDLVEPQRLIVNPAFRKRRFDGAPYGISGVLFKAVVSRYLLGGTHETLVIDAFTNTRESPLHAFLQMGAIQLGAEFHDTELASATPSIALLFSLSDLTRKAFSGDRAAFSRYLLAHDDGFGFSKLRIN